MTAGRSTAGGRSVSHAAAALQGASLRTLPLVLPVSLLSLANPLLALLAGPPSLDVLGEAAARATDGDSQGRRQRRSPGSTVPPRQNGTTVPVSSSPGGGLASLASQVSRAAASFSQDAHREAGSTPSAVLGRAARGSAHPVAHRATRDPGPAHDPTAAGVADQAAARGSVLGGALHRMATSALAAAARLDTGTRVTNGATPSTSETGDERAVNGREASDLGALPGQQVTGPSSASSPSASPAPAIAASGPGGSALGELVGRWQQSEALPELAPLAAPRAPFAPLATAVTTGFAESRPSPDGTGDAVSLDLVQLALDELLRREAEQHGLEGGLV